MSTRWKPRKQRIPHDEWALGIESYTIEREHFFSWGESTVAGLTRYLILHLGRVSFEWSWEVRS